MEKIEQEAQSPADVVLEGSKGKYISAVIVGIREDGSIDVASNLKSYEYVQYLFHRASFETFIHQRDAERPEKEEA